MALQSVSTGGNWKKPTTPGLEDLLRTEHDDLRRTEQAASNVLEPITQGIEAIGELLWRAADSQMSLDNKTLHGLGVLLVHLASVQEHVGFIEREAASMRSRL